MPSRESRSQASAAFDSPAFDFEEIADVGKNVGIVVDNQNRHGHVAQPVLNWNESHKSKEAESGRRETPPALRPGLGPHQHL